jgi:hypothetical protein
MPTNKPLRIHTGEVLSAEELNFMTPVPLRVPQALTDVTPTATGCTITFRDFIYRGGQFFPIKSIQELKK